MIDKEKKQKIIKSFQTGGSDTGSAQVQIALLSERIKELTAHLNVHKKDNHSRRGLLRMVGKRRKLLNYLKKHNNESYSSIISSLGLKK